MDEGRDVARALAERRQDDGDDVEAVEEVLAELPRLHHRLEVAVRRGDDADVDRDRLVAADAPDLALLEGAEDLPLQREREVADLVEEEGRAGGGLEEAGLAGLGAR